MQAVFRRIGIGRRYEEWFITDYDCPDAAIGKVLGEYESLSELNYLAGQIMEMRESDEFWQAVLDLGENTGSVRELINLTENMDCFDYLPGVCSDYDLGYYWIEESGCYDTDKLGALANYIDYEGFGRDVRLEEGGIFGDNGYVRSNGGRFVDIYDGDIKNIGSVHLPFLFVPHCRGRPNSPNDKICTFDIALRFGYSIIKTRRK